MNDEFESDADRSPARCAARGGDGTAALVVEPVVVEGESQSVRSQPAEANSGGERRPASSRSGNRRRVCLGLILVIALAARISTAVVYPAIQRNTHLSHGSDGYDHVAATLVAGGGYKFAADLGETMFLPPAYPLFLALLFLFTGPSLLAAAIAQSLLDTASCFMIYVLGTRRGGHRAGLFAAVLYALYPGAWIGCSRYLTEPLFVFLMLGFLVFFTAFVRSGTLRGLFAAGAFGALAVLCKSAAGALPVFILVCAPFVPAWRHCRSRVFGGLAVCLLMSGVFVFPWVYRNYRVSGSFVYPATSGGLALYTAYVYATHPDQRIRKSVHQAAAEVRQLAVDNGIRLDPRDSYPRWFYDPRDEVRLDKIAQRTARERIAADRGGYARHVVGNLWRFWWGAPSPRAIRISFWVNTPLMVLGVLGLVTARVWRHADLSLCLLVATYLFLAHVGILAVVRYSLTVMPILCLFGGLALVAVIERLRPKSGRSDLRDTVGSGSAR